MKKREKEIQESAKKFVSERLNKFFKEFLENAKNYIIMCETLDIPFTEDGKQ